MDLVKAQEDLAAEGIRMTAERAALDSIMWTRVINSSREVIRPIQSSLAVDSIMCLPPVYVSEIRSFIRGL